jgi:hypothetical protein
MIGKPENLLKWLYNQDKDKIFEIKEHKDKRSLSQNAYAWKLIMELGNVLRKSKEEVYLQMLKDYGQSEIVVILSTVNPHGYFKYYDKVRDVIINGNIFTQYKIYKGSSEYDSREMSIFIDGIIQECKQLGIETLSPEMIAKLDVI